MATNPILDELGGLSPGAQQALLGAHNSTALTPPPATPAPGLQAPSKIPPTPQIGAPPPVATATMSSPPPSLGASPAPNVTAPRGTLAGDQNERARMEATGPGITQIHSKIEDALPNHPTLGKILGYGAEIPARILEAAGATLGPVRSAEQLLPGTQAHHAMEMRNLNSNIGKESQENLQQTQAGEANARTGLTTAETTALPQKNEDTHELTQSEIAYHNASAAALLHPQAKTAFEAWQTQNPGKPIEEWLKTEAQNKPKAKQNDFEQYYKDFLADQGIQDSAHARLVAREKYAAAGQMPQRPAQVTIINPAGQIQTLHPGDTVAPGSTTPGGFNALSVNDQKGEQAAEKARTDAQKTFKLAQTLVANPSPTNDLALLMQYIGATKPESLGKLRLNNNEVNLVLGSRSTFGDLEALGQKLHNGQKLTPTQRQDMLGTMKILAGDEEGGGAAPAGADNEVYVGGKLVGHTVNNKYVPLAK